MAIRRSVAAGAVAASMAIGGVVGTVLFAPTVTSAQEDDEAPDEQSESDDSSRRHKRFGPGRMGLATAAETIGIDVEELVDALRDGQTIAEVAEANDVDPDTVIDAMVADATERLEALIEELPDRIAERVNEEFEPGRHRRGPGPRGRPGSWYRML